MGRVAVRNAVADYLESGIGSDDPAIPYLSAVKRHPPKVTSENEFFEEVAPGSGLGAVLFIYLKDQSEHRIATGGGVGGDDPPKGWKERTYECDLVCFLRSMKRGAEEAEGANDVFLDGLVDYIEANRIADAPGVVFQWGEGSSFKGRDIRVSAAMPKQIRKAVVQTFSVVSVAVIEMIPT